MYVDSAQTELKIASKIMSTFYDLTINFISKCKILRSLNLITIYIYKTNQNINCLLCYLWISTDYYQKRRWVGTTSAASGTSMRPDLRQTFLTRKSCQVVILSIANGPQTLLSCPQIHKDGPCTPIDSSQIPLVDPLRWHLRPLWLALWLFTLVKRVLYLTFNPFWLALRSFSVAQRLLIDPWTLCTDHQPIIPFWLGCLWLYPIIQMTMSLHNSPPSRGKDLQLVACEGSWNTIFNLIFARLIKSVDLFKFPSENNGRV